MGRTIMPNNSRNVLVICASVMFCVIVAVAGGIAHYTHDTNSTVTITSLLFANFATLIAALGALIKVDSVKQTAEDSSDKLDKVLNGEMADKIKQAYREVLAERKDPPPPRHRT